MQDRLKRANELLQFATHALDEVIEILEAAEIPGIRDTSKLVDESSLTLDHVQQALYAYVPELAPAWRDDPKLGDEMRDYGQRLVATRDLWSANRYEEAVQLWREYLAKEPFYFFDLLGKRMLANLEKTVKHLADLEGLANDIKEP